MRSGLFFCIFIEVYDCGINDKPSQLVDLEYFLLNIEVDYVRYLLYPAM